MIEDTSDSIREVQLVFAPCEGGRVMKTQNWSQRVLYQEYLLHSVIMHCFFT
ncbi:MAG: hypothetical protein K0S84_1598 [Nitrososphaera sp.]|jgi:hypothetical protein|nr:hypothetical protein [Nitrososphaera sp.]